MRIGCIEEPEQANAMCILTAKIITFGVVRQPDRVIGLLERCLVAPNPKSVFWGFYIFVEK